MISTKPIIKETEQRRVGRSAHACCHCAQKPVLTRRPRPAQNQNIDRIECHCGTAGPWCRNVKQALASWNDMMGVLRP
jgi:hypothetical protein